MRQAIQHATMTLLPIPPGFGVEELRKSNHSYFPLSLALKEINDLLCNHFEQSSNLDDEDIEIAEYPDGLDEQSFLIVPMEQNKIERWFMISIEDEDGVDVQFLVETMSWTRVTDEVRSNLSGKFYFMLKPVTDTSPTLF